MKVILLVTRFDLLNLNNGKRFGRIIRIAKRDAQFICVLTIFDVGQADSALAMTRNGDIVLIDSVGSQANGLKILEYIQNKALNGVGNFKTIAYSYFRNTAHKI